MKIFAIIAVILLFALALSMLALQSTYETRIDTVELDLTNGVYEPIYIIYDYTDSSMPYNATMEIRSYCPCTVNISFIKVYPVGNFTYYNVVIGPYQSFKDIEIYGLDTIMSIQPYNCSLVARLSYTIEHKPYIILALPSFILLLIATIMLINITMRKTLKRIKRYEY